MGFNKATEEKVPGNEGYMPKKKPVTNAHTHTTHTCTHSPITNTGKNTPATVGSELLIALAMN